MGWGIPLSPKDVVVSIAMTVVVNNEATKELGLFDSMIAVEPLSTTFDCLADFGSPVIATVGKTEYVGGIITTIDGCYGHGVPYIASNVVKASAWISPTITN